MIKSCMTTKNGEYAHVLYLLYHDEYKVFMLARSDCSVTIYEFICQYLIFGDSIYEFICQYVTWGLNLCT